jgi:outer membrane lipoprotein-sorting protein
MPKNRLFPVFAISFAVLIGASVYDSRAAAPAAGTAAAAPEAPPVEPPTEAEKFLDEAIKKVAAIKSVSAKMLEKVEMLGQKFEITGRYLRAPNDRIRLELNVVGLPDSKGSMLQVCNGTTFWDYQQVYETQIYYRRDAAPILAKVRSPELDENLREQVLNQMGLAGPEILLTGLRRVVKFDQKEEQTLDGRPVWVLAGNWKSREGLLGPNSAPLRPMDNLPSYIPSLVVAYLGKDDYWPYKVKLSGQQSSIVMGDAYDTRPIGPDGRRIGPRTAIQKPLLTKIELDYRDVQLNGSISDKEFVFQAPQGAHVEDDTRKILDGLEQAITMRAAQKKADAAKGDTAKAEESAVAPIDVPKSAIPPPAKNESSPDRKPAAPPR